MERGRVRVRENELNPGGGGRQEGLKKKISIEHIIQGTFWC